MAAAERRAGVAFAAHAARQRPDRRGPTRGGQPGLPRVTPLGADLPAALARGRGRVGAAPRRPLAAAGAAPAARAGPYDVSARKPAAWRRLVRPERARLGCCLRS